MSTSSKFGALHLLQTPWALFEAGSGKLIFANESLGKWLKKESAFDTLGAILPELVSEQNLKKLGKGRVISHSCQAMGNRGREIPAEYKLRKDEIDGQAVWILVGADNSKIAEKQVMLETYASSVERKQKQLDKKNREMRMVLDNLEQAVITIDLEGNVGPARSTISDEWFGEPGSDHIGKYLARFDPDIEFRMELGLEAVFENFLPQELTLGQMPRSMHHEGQYLSIEYQPLSPEPATESEPVGEGDEPPLAGLLLVISDVTAQKRQEELEASQRELLLVLDRVMKDKAGFVRFVGEAGHLVDELVSREQEEISITLRHLHTLKGNCMLFDVTSIAHAAHQLESRIDDTQAPLLDSDKERLNKAWHSLLLKLNSLLKYDEKEVIEVSVSQYHRLLGELNEGVDHEQLSRTVKLWSAEPTSKRLRELGDGAKALAHRRHSGDLQVSILDHGLRLDPAIWSDFWSAMVHVSRNAIAHGFSEVEEGVQNNDLNLHLETVVRAGKLHFVIKDNGRGIAWHKVAQKAKDRQMPHGSRAELVDAIFSPGLSTRDKVDNVAGRGVGLDAVKTICEELGGTVEVESEEGEGTTFRFVFPGNMAMAENDVLPLSRAGS